MSDQGPPLDGDEGGLRQYIAKLEEERRQMQESLPAQLQEAEDRGAARTQRKFEAERVFGDLGYPKLADLWVQSNPEGSPEPDAAKEFLATYGLEPSQPGTTPPPPKETAPPPEVATAAQAFTQPLTATPGGTNFTAEDFRKALRDPNRRAEALQAEKEGRVEKKYGDIDPRLISVRDDAGFFSGEG